MFKKVAFTYYPVDVARARKFYEETLGLKAGSAGNQGDKWWVEYDLPGGGCLALTNFTKEKPSDTAGGTIAFEPASAAPTRAKHPCTRAGAPRAALRARSDPCLSL